MNSGEAVLAIGKGSEGTIRIFEIVSVVFFILVLWWLIKQRNPFYLGVYIGTFMVWGHDWFWTTNGFFRATFDNDLIGIPGIEIGGQEEPLAIPMNYAFLFGLGVILYLKTKHWFDEKFGHWQYPLLWLAGAIGVGIYEIPVVRILGIWTYHQKSEYEFIQFPWSNFWLAANLLGLSAVFAALMCRWANIPDRVGLSLRSEVTWKGLLMGSFPIMVAFYLTGVLQLWWYSSVDVWIEPAPRPF